MKYMFASLVNLPKLLQIISVVGVQYFAYLFSLQYRVSEIVVKMKTENRLAQKSLKTQYHFSVSSVFPDHAFLALFIFYFTILVNIHVLI